MTAEPRTMVIEGRRVLVTETPRVIPPTLGLLLEGGRDRAGRLWHPVRIAFRDPLRLRGTRTACLMQDHRLVRWVDGFHTGSDHATRFLSLQACADCGAVCVRDRSFDSLEGLSAGRRPLRRRDEIIGWYSGARPGQREYT